MNKNPKTLFAVSLFAAGLLAASTASAVTIDTVLVGDAGNANDTTGYGGVGYDYHIGTYEVTNSQYTAFLNATAASDPHSLYNSNMGSSTHGGINRACTSGSYNYSVKSGFANKPVIFVDFWDAARFSNWLTSGSTETGVYALTSTGISNNTITRDETAWDNGGVAVASRNEWYKAAYYDPTLNSGAGGYWLAPTQSNTLPDAALPNSSNSNSANWNLVVGTVTDVGSYTIAGSHYGTFDQAGNVTEWNDDIFADGHRGRWGGSYSGEGGGNMLSSGGGSRVATGDSDRLGFRIASLEPIPEPSAYAAILGCLGLTIALTRRKGRGTL